MEEQQQLTISPDQPTEQTADSSVYEQMWRYMYDYRFGRITFLELLDKWKEVLNLPET